MYHSVSENASTVEREGGRGGYGGWGSGVGGGRRGGGMGRGGGGEIGGGWGGSLRLSACCAY
jgi:hypothetical protein